MKALSPGSIPWQFGNCAWGVFLGTQLQGHLPIYAHRRCWQLLSVLRVLCFEQSKLLGVGITFRPAHIHGLLDLVWNIRDRPTRAARAELGSFLFFPASILLCFWEIFKHGKRFQLFSGPHKAAQLKSRCAAPFSASLLRGSQGKPQQAVRSSSEMRAELWENCPRNIFGWWKDYSWTWYILGNYASGAENQLWRENPMLILSWCILVTHFQDEIFLVQESLWKYFSIICKLQSTKGRGKSLRGLSLPLSNWNNFIFNISNSFLCGIPSLFPPLISNLEVWALLWCELQVLQDKCTWQWWSLICKNTY